NANGPGVLVDEPSSTSLGGFHDSQIEIVGTHVMATMPSLFQFSPIDLGSVAFGTWHHVALRFDSSTLHLDGFLDGIKTASNTEPFDRFATGTQFYALGLGDSASNLGGGA